MTNEVDAKLEDEMPADELRQDELEQVAAGYGGGGGTGKVSMQD